MIEQMISGGIFVPVFAIAGFFTWVLTVTVARIASRTFIVWRETRLKELMLERGMSTMEIERVIHVGHKPCGNVKEKMVSSY